jgi:glycosyltransferase involved in cell wall biosynthesis
MKKHNEKSEPFISVCLASYNGEKYIRRQIESILKQLDDNSELVISDDSSTDNTISIIESIKDSRIKLLKNQNFRNPVWNFENAIKHARGEYLFLADQDDVWVDSKIDKMLPLLKKYDIVVSDCQIVDDNLEILKDSYFREYGSRAGFLNNFYKNSYMGCCLAFSSRLKSIALPFPEKTPMHDIWIGMIGEVFGNSYFLNEPLILHTFHGQNFSSTGFKSPNSFFKKIKIRIDVLTALIGRIIRQYIQ